jgi:hypothetical protein
MSNPTFCAKFADSTETRMTVWHDEGRASLDLKRGVRLSRYAYETRMHNKERRNGFDGPPVAVPPIVSAHFENDGVVLAEYNAKQIAEAVS